MPSLYPQVEKDRVCVHTLGCRSYLSDICDEHAFAVYWALGSVP